MAEEVGGRSQCNPLLLFYFCHVSNPQPHTWPITERETRCDAVEHHYVQKGCSDQPRSGLATVACPSRKPRLAKGRVDPSAILRIPSRQRSSPSAITT